jgi:hypothetical protein
MIENRNNVDICRVPFTIQECIKGGRGELVYAFTASKSLVDQGRLTALYNDLIKPDSALASTMTAVQRYTHACLCLCVLLATRAFGHDAFVGGRNIRDRAPIFMYHLRKCWSMVEKNDAREEGKYQEAYLWILYHGALFEQRSRIIQESTGHVLSGLDFFQTKLVDKAKLASVTTWEEMSAINARFLASPLLCPSGDLWFDTLMKLDQPLHQES